GLSLLLRLRRLLRRRPDPAPGRRRARAQLRALGDRVDDPALGAGVAARAAARATLLHVSALPRHPCAVRAAAAIRRVLSVARGAAAISEGHLPPPELPLPEAAEPPQRSELLPRAVRRRDPLHQ